MARKESRCFILNGGWITYHGLRHKNVIVLMELTRARWNESIGREWSADVFRAFSLPWIGGSRLIACSLTYPVERLIQSVTLRLIYFSTFPSRS